MINTFIFIDEGFPVKYLLSCAAACFVSLQAFAAEPAKQPNVLYILADDLRCDLGCEGGPAKTPNLDALAKRGVRFSHAYCQQAVCNPSRSSFLTGKRPDTLHLWNNSVHFRANNPGLVTLPQWFLRNGYVTRDVGKVFHNWHTEPKADRPSWSADEFLHYANHGNDAPAVKGELPPNRSIPFGRKYGEVPVCERRDVPDEAYYDGRVANEAIRVLGEVKDKPFFLAVGFWKPHAPFNAPKKYWDLYDPAKLPGYDPNKPKNGPDIALHESGEILGSGENRITPTKEQAAEMRHGYLANVSYMDAQLGKVLDSLDKSGVAENTVIVFHSDHGYHLGEHTLWGKTSNFEFDARVPLLIVPPKSAQVGKVADGPVELIDLFPTVCDLAEIKLPQDLQGVSLMPTLKDATKATKEYAFTQFPRPAYFDRTPKAVPDAMGYSVGTATVRYTEWREWGTGKVIAAEFYDHATDKNETVNAIDATELAEPRAAARAALHKEFPPGIAPSKR